ncbi:MAG: SPOR domain-containing protein [Bacteroidales bacterium]
MLFFLFQPRLNGQFDPEYYEISVNLEIQRVGATEIDAVIHGKEIYLSVTQLFDFLKIKNIPSPELETISGFFIHPDNEYVIDKTNLQIRFGDETFRLESGEVMGTETNLYLKSPYFSTVFGLECIFDFRTLSVRVETKLELPLIREMRQAEMRKNLSIIKGEVEADTIIGRTYPMFKFGMADWSAIATEEINGESEVRANLTLGAMIAGGEATASLNYDSRIPFEEKQQYYLWRYVNNDLNYLRQVKVGKIFTNSVSTIYDPVVGVQLTNTPSSFRRSYGSYTLSDHTEPGWIVELYVNNVLVDYVKADASGYFTFDVPIVYGNTMVKLKFFSPWGEEQTREQNINIPFNFLPVNTLEYNISAGFVEDSEFSKFTRASLNYGLSRRITIGTGVEYLSSLSTKPFMPFFNGSLRITNNLLLTGDYVYGVKTGGALTYRLLSGLQFDLKYTYYEKDQEAINFNYREERKATVSLPLKIKSFSAYNRFSFSQLVLPASTYTTGEWLFSSSVRGVSTNLTTYAIFAGQTDPYVYSNLSLAFRLPWRIVLMPQAQYAYTRNMFLTAKVKVEKPLFNRAFLNVSYERDFRTRMHLAELGFRYNFSFAQTGLSARYSDRETTMVQYARGSLITDAKSRYFKAENRPNVGRGGVIIKPFLDLNSNGKRDPGEKGAPGLNLRANGGRVDKSENDTVIAILGLEPYTTCFIELDPNSFYSIAWRLPFKTLSVEVDPNIMKSVDIPISIAGEASGFVTIDRSGKEQGQGRIIVNYLNERSEIVASTLTEDDGYYSYFGLAPGKYYTRVDTAQLSRLGMICNPDSIGFRIEAILDGDMVDGLDFMLYMITPDQVVEDVVKTRMDTTYIVVHELVEELMTITEDSWAIQLGAFKVKNNATRFQKKLREELGKDVEIVMEDGFHKIRILEIKDRVEVDAIIAMLHETGHNEFWVIHLKAMQQLVILKEVTDTVEQVVEIVIEEVEDIRPEEAGVKDSIPEVIPLVVPEMIMEDTVQAEPEVEMPKISLQAGVFPKLSLAMKAKKRIESKLNLTVEIVQEWDYYRVLVRGFYTVQETYKYYPELVGLGYDKIILIDEREK